MEEKFKPLFRQKGVLENLRPSIPDDIFDSIEELAPEKRNLLRKEFDNLRAIYSGKRIERTFTSIYHRHGYELCLFMVIVLSFYRLNLVSLIYVILASMFSFCSHFFNS